MKKLVNALTGKKAMIIALAAAVIFTVLDVIAAFRMGTKIDFVPMAATFAVIAAWAEVLAARDKKNKKNGEN